MKHCEIYLVEKILNRKCHNQNLQILLSLSAAIHEILIWGYNSRNWSFMPNLSSPENRKCKNWSIGLPEKKRNDKKQRCKDQCKHAVYDHTCTILYQLKSIYENRTGVYRSRWKERWRRQRDVSPRWAPDSPKGSSRSQPVVEVWIPLSCQSRYERRGSGHSGGSFDVNTWRANKDLVGIQISN